MNRTVRGMIVRGIKIHSFDKHSPDKIFGSGFHGRIFRGIPSPRRERYFRTRRRFLYRGLNSARRRFPIFYFEVRARFEMSLPTKRGTGHIARTWCGVVAQLVERLVRNEKVAGSNPVGSTNSISSQISFFPNRGTAPRICLRNRRLFSLMFAGLDLDVYVNQFFVNLQGLAIFVRFFWVMSNDTYNRGKFIHADLPDMQIGDF